MWPAYRAWYLKEGESARPDLSTCRRMLERWMPELEPLRSSSSLRRATR